MKQEVQGAVIQHWLDKRIKEGKPTKLEGNVPRVSPETLIKLNDARNEMLGSNLSIREWMSQIADDDPDYRDKRKPSRRFQRKVSSK